MRASGQKQAIFPWAALVGLLAAGSPAAAQELKYRVGMLGNFTPDGLLIQKVIDGTPAEQAGLQRGDLILKVDGRLITSQADFTSVINTSGRQVVLVIKKGTSGRLGRVGLDLVGPSTMGAPAPRPCGASSASSPPTACSWATSCPARRRRGPGWTRVTSSSASTASSSSTRPTSTPSCTPRAARSRSTSRRPTAASSGRTFP